MESRKKIIIGTRGSKLALWQAHHLQDALKTVGQAAELKIIKTQGDRIQHLSFDKMEGKGFFTKEIEDALLAKEIDVAVHSLKDLPTESPEGLIIAGLSYREDPADLLIIRKEVARENSRLPLAPDALIGTSSIRRKTQILQLLPEARVKDLRGNVPTRIGKLKEGLYDAIIIASAGVRRLEYDLSDLVHLRLNPREFVPAPAQGVVGFQARTEDIATRKILDTIHKREVARCTNIERKILRLMDGGCQTPLGVYCEQDANGHFHVSAAYAPEPDAPLRRASLSQSTSFGLAEKIVDELKNQ